MSNLGQRVLSAVVLGAVFLSALWFNQWVFYATMAIALALALHEYFALLFSSGKINKQSRSVLFVVILIIGLLMSVGILANIKYGFNMREFMKFVFLPILIFSLIVILNRKITFTIDAVIAVAIFWIVIPFVLCPVLLNYDGAWQKEMFLGIMAISWSSDIFAYFIGSSIGKHKLIERVSPNKTIEGAIGGLLGGLLVAFLVPKVFQTPLESSQWTVVGGIVVIASVLGDLFESMIKRNVRVKDSGTLIPGHGGVLDRIDGLLFVIPAVATYLYFI